MLTVKRKCCNECLFGKNKIVSEERKSALLDEIQRKDSHFICHKATIVGKNHVCRGFYDSRSSNLIRISQRLGVVSFVD